jgi:hypothetical protein
MTLNYKITMKQKTLLFLLALGVLAAAYSVGKIQPTSADLLACCDPATDPDCDNDDDDDGGNNGDSMPTQILG